MAKSTCQPTICMRVLLLKAHPKLGSRAKANSFILLRHPDESVSSLTCSKGTVLTLCPNYLDRNSGHFSSGDGVFTSRFYLAVSSHAVRVAQSACETYFCYTSCSMLLPITHFHSVSAELCMIKSSIYSAYQERRRLKSALPTEVFLFGTRNLLVLMSLYGVLSTSFIARGRHPVLS